MNHTLFANIPQPLQDVAVQIHLQSGIPITVELATYEVRKEFPRLSEHPALLDIWPEKERICIWYPNEFPSLPDLCHEVIHARRNILESVPRISPLSTAQHPELIYALENDLEHLFVIPEEISYFPSQIAKWEKHYFIAITQAAPIELDLFRHWAFINVALPGSNELLEFCRIKLQKSNLLDRAESYRSEIEAALPSKEKLLSVAFKWFPHICRNVCMQRYVASNQCLQVMTFTP